jgi:hypothetical protein
MRRAMNTPGMRTPGNRSDRSSFAALKCDPAVRMSSKRTMTFCGGGYRNVERRTRDDSASRW